MFFEIIDKFLNTWLLMKILEVLYWSRDKTNLKYVCECKPYFTSWFGELMLGLKFIV